MPSQGVTEKKKCVFHEESVYLTPLHQRTFWTKILATTLYFVTWRRQVT
jgi:hypothetical protein